MSINGLGNVGESERERDTRDEDAETLSLKVNWRVWVCGWVGGGRRVERCILPTERVRKARLEERLGKSTVSHRHRSHDGRLMSQLEYEEEGGVVREPCQRAVRYRQNPAEPVITKERDGRDMFVYLRVAGFQGTGQIDQG